MSMTPDYFTTSCGRSKLNREKFKFCSNEIEKPEKSLKTEAIEDRRKTKFFVANMSYIDNTKLLTKRESIKTVVVAAISNQRQNNRHGKLLVCDKDIKCAINQKIKFSQDRNRQQEISNSNEILDNRLTYQRKYFNDIFGHNQTDLIVLPPLDF